MQLNKGKKNILGRIVASLFLLLFATFFFCVDDTKAAEGDTIKINLSNVANLSSTADYSVTTTNNVIELLTKDATYELTGTMTGHVIVRKDCTVILNGVTITAGDYTQASPYKASFPVGTAALSIQGNATCTVQLKGSNNLTGKSGYSGTSVLKNSAGIYVENTINTVAVGGDAVGTRRLASIIIEDGGSGTGKLTVKGGTQSAAIGGNVNRATGNITVNSGVIEAIAGSWSTGLGDGDSEKNTANTDLVAWSCADIGKEDGKPDTCQAAKIVINDGNLWLEGQNAAPAIGTSDELSGQNGTGDGSGVKDRIWYGQSITINGGTTICVGGSTSYTSIGAGLYTILTPGNITINQNEAGTTRLIAISREQGYTVNNSGMTADQEHPNISAESTANVFSFKYTATGFTPDKFTLTNMLKVGDKGYELSQSAVDFVNNEFDLFEVSHSGMYIKGLALVLPDGHYSIKVDADDIADVELEGGGMVYGDASDPSKKICTINLKVEKDDEPWNNCDKTFVLRTSESTSTSGTDITTFAVKNGTYYVHEKVDGKYIYTGKKIIISGASASVTLDYYTVTFWEEKEHSVEAEPYDSQIVFGGNKATIPSSPTKTGYTFAGWSEDLSEKSISEKTEVNATWTANTYSVHFNKNTPSGGTVTGTTGDSNSKQSFTYDEEQEALAENGFTCEGYLFKGWSTKSTTGVYPGSGAITWDYTDKEQVKNLTTTANGVVELYAVWEKNAAINGNVTIEYSYIEEGGASETVKDIPVSSRAQTTVVELWRNVAGENGTTKVDETEITFAIDTTVKETVEGKEYLVSAKDFTFTGYPASDENGNAYEYFAKTALATYNTKYPDAEKKLELRLTYNPACITVPLEISLDGTFEGVEKPWPQEVYVKVVYRNHTETDWKAKPTAEKGDVIIQHGGAKDALDGSYVACTWDATAEVYKGAYPVWLYSLDEKQNKILYDYHMVVVGYKLSEAETKAVGDAGFAVVYDDATDVATDTTNWVYCSDLGDKTVSGIIRATLGIKIYDITYNLNGDETNPVTNGTTEKPAPGEYTYGVGVDANDMPVPSRPNYDFDGWYGVDGNGDIDLNNKIESIAADQIDEVILSANWTPKTYAIAYELREGAFAEGADEPKTYVYGESTQDIPEPAKANYTFIGWYLAEDVDGVYDDTQKVSKISATQSGDVTLYARWEANAYDIIYNLNGSADKPAAFTDDPVDTYIYGEGLAELPTPEREDYIFEGWYNDLGEGVDPFTEENKATSIAGDQAGEIKLIANWKLQESDVEITFKKDGETWTEGTPVIQLKDKDGNIYDGSGKMPNGEYTIIVDGRETEETIIVDYKKPEDNKKDLAFYTLTLHADTGCENVTGGGVYLANERVGIKVNDVDGYCFTKWTANPETYTIAAFKQLEISMPNYPLTLTAHADRYASQVRINVNLDGNPWNEKLQGVTLLRNEENGKEFVNLDNIPNGEYKILVDGEDTRQTIVVDNTQGVLQEATLDYFTLTILGSDGIESADGSGIYLSGEVASVITKIEEDYCFDGWESEGEAAPLTTKNGKIVMNRSLTLKPKAHAPAEDEEGSGSATFCCYTVNHYVMGEDGAYANEANYSEMLHCEPNKEILCTTLVDGTLEDEVITYSHASATGPEGSADKLVAVDGAAINLYYARSTEKYALTLVTGDGVTAVSEEAMGNYAAGETINISAVVPEDYIFTKWAPNVTGYQEYNTREATITMPASDLTLEARGMLRRTSVVIGADKDDTPWGDAVITLVDNDGNIIAEDQFDSVPDGEYHVYVDGKDTGAVIEVEYDSGLSLAEQLEFYTLSLERGTGIGKVAGDGVYIAGMAVSISAEVETGYSFTMWNGYKDTAISTHTTTFQMPAESVTLKANAEAVKADGGATGSETPGSGTQAAPTGGAETRQTETKTGDSSTPIFWILILVGSLLACGAVVIFKKKQNKK
ncbi:InlB B-repeat-containing protein [Ohessyouella blattaphilus]|uniref:InlB B-repeat-containing protein n=1 Tax=Ohessyouella blattaphilus TaxID=2949333 RepID=A0ABT1EHX4_9FIRM|nr:InlB B-repeat-containing protein [Ohessyouella blattaphilus]MCP1110290.1 InlB B-repeat-containing protein [Ohessyouella blattaphilus]MCR8563684.1 InlB B-repeat-containing protein [Ohessyouella blattaphilus]